MKCTLWFLSVLVGLFIVPNVMAQNNGPGGEERERRINGRKFRVQPRDVINPDVCPTLNYQTIDGTCNNISDQERMEWGATDITMDRILESAYGLQDPFNAMGGENRISPRAISNIVVQSPQPILSQMGLSALTFSWGQFLDHDITLTPEAELEVAMIGLPDDEPLFTFDIPFFRSEFFNLRSDGVPREQLNIITAWIDASMVYGADVERAIWLRTLEDGKLKTSRGNLLPFNTSDGEFESDIDADAPSTAGGDEVTKMWVAGDVRAGEQAGLTALHTLFVREHNRICDELIGEGMTDDEEIYQAARRKVISLIQKITYQEFLPALGVPLPEYQGYDEDAKPNITTEFATAGFRLGHTMVVDSLSILGESCKSLRERPLSLVEAFFNTEVLQTYGIDPVLRGLATQIQHEVDPHIVPELRDFLFAPVMEPRQVVGTDLASLNIQRGRDHGLPDYNALRAYYLSSAATTFEDISDDPATVSDLTEAFQNDINDIDAWVGLLAEDLVEGTSLGPTLHAMMVDQFGRIRDGDRFYYESYLSDKEKQEIQSTTLSNIIQRNTEIEKLADNVMLAQICASTTGVEETNDVFNTFDVFPNPSDGVIRISQLPAEGALKSYLVVDVLGQQVQGEQSFTSEIDLSALPAGVYFVHFYSYEGRRVVKKVVILD